MIEHRGDVEERIIKAAVTERKRHVEGVRPSGPKSSMPKYAHDFADMNGWGSDRLKEWRADFLRSLSERLTPADITELDECLRWTAEFVTDAKERRALWGWAIAKAKGPSFKAWCKREHIHPNTGRSRKNDAIEQIYAQLVREMGLRVENDATGTLLDTPDPRYVSATIDSAAQERAKRFTWRDDPALKPVFDPATLDTSWADEQNARRRKREEKRRRERAA